MAATYEPWPSEVVEQIARVLGDTAEGFSGSQIADLLRQTQMPDPGEITKWRRLNEAMGQRQAQDGNCRRLVTLLAKAMAPVRYTGQENVFAARKDALNEVLAHVGLRVTDKGEVSKGARATTLSEAAQIANAVRTELRRRGTHPDVLRFCTQELLERNTFHAQLEAVKSIADRLRTMTGLSEDGAALIDATLAKGQRAVPRVAVNAGATQTDQDEQKGLANFCKGLFSMIRNPTAHQPRILGSPAQDELIEVLTAISLVHHRLDRATVNP